MSYANAWDVDEDHERFGHSLAIDSGPTALGTLAGEATSVLHSVKEILIAGAASSLAAPLIGDIPAAFAGALVSHIWGGGATTDAHDLHDHQADPHHWQQVIDVGDR